MIDLDIRRNCLASATMARSQWNQSAGSVDRGAELALSAGLRERFARRQLAKRSSAVRAVKGSEESLLLGTAATVFVMPWLLVGVAAWHGACWQGCCCCFLAWLLVTFLAGLLVQWLLLGCIGCSAFAPAQRS